MKKVWRQIDGKLYRIDNLPRPKRKTPYIIADMSPYRAITGDMAGQYITSRSEHRAYLRRNGLEEVGNEYDYMTKHGGMTPDNPVLKDDETETEAICQNLTKNLNQLYR